jgi:hypothetical protein
MATIKLAEALLRRKELQAKVEQLKHIKDNQLIYEIRGQRAKVTDSLEDLNLNIPKLEVNQVTREYDHYARALRLIDGYIQQVNWTAEVNADESIMGDYKEAK